MFHRVREFRRRSIVVTADTPTSGVLNRAAWSGLAAGLVFGLFTLIIDGPEAGAVQGTSFAALMILVFQFAFLMGRAKRRRERDEEGQ